MTHFKIEHRMTWALGDSWMKVQREPEDIAVVDVEAQWDPSDDTVKDARFSIGTPTVGTERMGEILDELRGQLKGMLDSALTEAIDNAKRERQTAC